MSGAPGIFHDHAQALLAAVAHGFARCGFADEAMATAQSVRQEAGTLKGRDSVASRMAIAVLAEIAKSRGQRGDIAGALKELAALPPMPPTLIAASAVAAAEAKYVTVAGSTPAKTYLWKQAARASDYFLQAQNDRERRVLIHHFAALILTASRTNGPLLDASGLLDLLISERSRIGATSWRARATCELGYTATVLRRDDAQKLVNEGVAIAQSFRISTFPLDPMPSGACGYWLKQSNNTARAQQVADQHIENWRPLAVDKPGAARWADTGTLLGLAISYAEFESGEIMIDWGRRVWDQ